MFHQSSATANPGQLVVAFPLRLPSLAPMPSNAGKFRATVVSLITKVEAVHDSPYKMKMALTFRGGAERYSTYFVQPFAPGVTPEVLSKRLKDFNDKIAAGFPYMANVPSLKWVYTDDKNAGNFIVTVPSYCKLYTDSFGMWDILGFTAKYYDLMEVTLANATSSVEAYGFDNSEGKETRIVRSRQMAVIEAFSKIYAQLVAVTGRRGVEDPRIEVEYSQGEVPLTLQRLRPVNQTGLIQGLGEAIDSGLRLLNVHPEAITLEWAGKELLLRSREWQGSSANLELELTITSEDLVEYLQLEQPTFTFPLYDAVSYVLHPREESNEDALLSEYPFRWSRWGALPALQIT